MRSFRPVSPVFRRFLRTRPSVGRRPLISARVDQPSPTPIPTLETPGTLSAIVDHEAGPLSQLPPPMREQECESIAPTRRTSPKQKQADDIVRSKEKRPSADKDLPGLSKYAYRWDTTAPNGEQLARADKFFMQVAPELLWTKSKFREIERGNAPEVAFLGRSNVGKSSLLNALLNQPGLAYTSSKPGRTKAMSAFSVHNGKLLLLDMPGYGKGSQAEWGTQIMKYLHGRKQLRRTFVLLDCLHGIKKADMLLLEAMSHADVSFQIVLSKIDRVQERDLPGAFEKARYLLETGIGGRRALGEVLAVAADPKRKGEKRKGISELRWSIMAAAGLERWGLK